MGTALTYQKILSPNQTNPPVNNEWSLIGYDTSIMDWTLGVLRWSDIEKREPYAAEEKELYYGGQGNSSVGVVKIVTLVADMTSFLKYYQDQLDDFSFLECKEEALSVGLG